MDITKFKMALLIMLVLLLCDTGSKVFNDSVSKRISTAANVKEAKPTFIDSKRIATILKGSFAMQDNAPYLADTVGNGYKPADDRSRNDFKLGENNLRSDVNVTGEKVGRLRRRVIKGRKQCVHLPNFHNKWIEMIVTCPRYYQNIVTKVLCHRSLKLRSRINQTQYAGSENTTVLDIQNLPVQDDQGTVYGNIYCAVCNQITNLHTMDVLIECNQTTQQTTHQTTHLKVVDGGKEISIFKSLPVGKCKQTLIPSNPSLIRTCRPGGIANLHLRMMTRENQGLGQNSLKYPVSFTVLMNFGFDGKTHVLFSNTHVEIERYVEKKCQSMKEVFVSQLNSCRKVHCSEGYSLTRFGCVARGGKKKLNLVHSNDSHIIVDSQTLANLDKIAHVSLEMNITYGDLRSLVSSDLETQMVDGISELLNINRDRIQNLSIAILNDTVHGNHFHIHMIPKTKFENKPSVHKNKPSSNNIRVKNLTYSIGKHNVPSTNSKHHFKDTNASNPNFGNKSKHKLSSAKKHMYLSSKSKPYFKQKLKSQRTSDNGIKSTKRKINPKLKPLNANKVYLKKRKQKIHYVKPSEPDTRNNKWENIKSTPDTMKNQWENINSSQPDTKNNQWENINSSQPDTKYNKWKNINSFQTDTKNNQWANIKSSEPDTKNSKWENSSTTIRVSFLLLPSRNGSRTEKSVSSLVKKIKEVIADEKFTLIINKTVIRVVNNNKEKDHWLGTDFCFTGIPMTLFSDDFELLLPNPKEGRNVTQVYVNRTQTLYGPGQYQMSIIVQHTGDVTNYDGFVIVCSMPRIADDSCRRVEIPKGEYELLANRSVAVSGKVYDTDEYNYLDDDLTTIEICIPGDSERPRKQQGRFFIVPGCDRGYEAFVKAEGYLTDILGRVSIVALALVLLTYILLKPLRNLAGINIMNLTFALLVAETVFALGEDTQTSWLCSVIAISLHYFVLASFFWMNIMAYDIHNTLVSNSFSVGVRGADKFGWRYALYGWGTPFLIVATCVVVDFTHVVSGLRIGYGKMTPGSVMETSSGDYDASANSTNGKRFNETNSQSEGCWIQSPEAALYVFGAPMLVIFIVNGFFFIKTILSIQQTTKLAHLKTRRSSVYSISGKREVILYVRLSTVMGFTWIFGLASSLVSVITTTPTSAICYTVHLLAILFTVFNCSHGFFIFFAFIVKKRVWYMYKTLWNRIQNRSLSPFFTRSMSKSGFQ